MSSTVTDKRGRAMVASPLNAFDGVSPPWASLHTDLVGLIGCRVLAGDLLDYVRFRAVCTYWRCSTVCPRGRGVIDPCFHPRRWMMLPDGHGLHQGQDKARFFNLSTGAFVRPHIPLFGDHFFLCQVEGLIMLQQRHDQGGNIRLLHPFTGDVVQLPSVRSIQKSLGDHLNPLTYSEYHDVSHNSVIASLSVSGDGIVSVMIELSKFSCVLCATTKDDQWSFLATWNFVLLATPLSFQGKIYILGHSFPKYTSEHPSLVDLDDLSELQIMQIAPPCSESSAPKLIATCPMQKLRPPFHLVECDSKILLIGYKDSVLLQDMIVYSLADLALGTVVPLKSMGCNALLIDTHLGVSVSFKVIPGIAGDTIVTRHPYWENIIEQYHLGDDTWSSTPTGRFTHGVGVPCVCNLIDHLYKVCHCDFLGKQGRIIFPLVIQVSVY